MKCCQFLFAAAVLSLSAAWVQADVIPADRLPWPGTWQAAGVPGGIPTNRTHVIDVTQAPYNADNTGATSAVAAINAAISAAKANDVVYCPPGTYLIDGSGTCINLNKSNVTLRGSYNAATHTWNTIFKGVGSGATVTMGIASAWRGPSGSTTNGYALGDYPAGSTVFDVGSATSFVIGSQVRFWQNADTSIPTVDVFGRLNHLDSQICMVTAKTSNTITVTPALMAPLEASRSPEVSYNANGRSGIGVEDIYFDGSGKTGPYMIRGFSTSRCWLRNVYSYHSYEYHIYFNYAVQDEIRHCYLNENATYVPNNAGIKFDVCSSNLIIDNILYKVRPHIQINGFASTNLTGGGSSGNVVAYNLVINTYTASGLEGGSLESSHWPHCRFDLYEGNVCNKFSADGYFGSASHITASRNWFRGYDPESGLTQNFQCVSICRFAHYYNLVGNILGDPAKTFTVDAGETHPPYTTLFIYRFGFPNMDNSAWSGIAEPSKGVWWADYPNNTGSGGYQELDRDVRNTILLKGNYNSQDARVPAAEQLAQGDTIPNSLFLVGKPGWFGDLAWPAFDPSNPNFSYDAIPAGYRYVHGVDPPGSDTVRAPTVATTSIQVY